MLAPETVHSFIMPILFVTGFIAGAVDAIAGGGGLVSLPVLLGLGLPPHTALGTNKLQASIGTSIATYSYYRQGWWSLKKVSKGLVFSLVGTVIGVWLCQVMSNELLKKVIPLLLGMILIYTIASPKMGKIEQQAKLSEPLFYSIFGFLLGFYDGFFGPGTGSLWVYALTFFLGYNLTKATAYTKIFNLNSNIVATLCFAVSGSIDYRVALCMAAGQMIGGRLGAHLAIKKGANIIRPVFLTVVSATILSLIYRNYGDANMLSGITLGQVALLALSLVAIAFTGYALRKRS